MDWCWSWNSNTLATSCKELTHWKRLWCWEGLGAWGEGDDRGWDGWMASPTRWTWFGWTLGDGDGQGGLACWDSWGPKDSDTTEQLNWTEQEWSGQCCWQDRRRKESIVFTHNTYDTNSVASFHIKDRSPTLDINSVSYNSILFWHQIPGVTVRLQRWWAQAHKTVPTSDISCKYWVPVGLTLPFELAKKLELSTTHPFFRFHTLIEWLMELRQVLWLLFSSVQFSLSVVSNSLRPHGLQHTRPLCPSPMPRVYSNSCP